MPRSLINALIVGIGKYTLPFAMQQMVGMANIVLVRGVSMDTVSYLGIYSEVSYVVNLVIMFSIAVDF